MVEDPEAITDSPIVTTDRRRFLPTVGGVTAALPLSPLPQLQGRRGDPREWIFCHYDPRWSQWQPNRFVMDREWKLYGGGRNMRPFPGGFRPYALSSARWRNSTDAW